MDFAAIADRAVQIIGSADPAQFETAYTTMVADTVVEDATELPSNEVLRVILSERAEWLSKSAVQREAILALLTVQDNVPVSPGSIERDTLIDVFGAGSATISALAAKIPQNVPAWPRLTRGNVSDALRMRAAGEV